MTSADAPAPHRRSAALARGWRAFRLWRRGRPFWGGLFLLLAGVEILISGGFSLGHLQLRVGLTGLQYYIIPAILGLCGLLSWLTPAQRIFYGVLGALVAVYSLIGVNLGGFFVGMLLGMVGGALCASWVPVTPADPAEQDDGSEPDESNVDEPDTTVDELLTGPLTDVLPPSTASPVTVPRAAGPAHAAPAGPAHAAPTGPANAAPTGPANAGPAGPARAAPAARNAADEDVTAEGLLPRRSPPTLAMILVPLVLAAAVLVAGPGARPAFADPCPAPKPPTTAPKPPVPVPPRPTTTATSSPTLTPTAGPTPTTQQGNPLGNLIGGVLDAIGDLLGIGGQPPTSTQPAAPAGAAPAAGATAAGVAAPPAAGAPKAAAPGPRQPTPTCAATAPPAKARTLAAPNEPAVGARFGKLTGDSVTINGFFFDGVTELERADKSKVRVLRFLMDSSTVTDFKLVTFDVNGKPTTITSQRLTVEGKVRFYTSRFSGRIGPLTVTFTPDLPPPPLPIPLPIPLIFADPEIDLVLVVCDRLTGRPTLAIKPS